MIDLASLQFVGGGLARPECVLATAAGDFFVSDKRGGVSHIKPNGETEFIGGGDILPNGIALMPDNSFIIANLADDGGVWALSREGVLSHYLGAVDGQKLGSVNFVRVDHLGRLWICVSTLGQSGNYRTDVANGFICVVDERGSRIVADGLGWTNECLIDPDAGFLYVNETFGRRLTRYDLAEDGSLGNRVTVTEFGFGTYPDGIALDEEGFLWVVSVISNRVIRVSPEGAQEIMLEDSDPEQLERLERALHAQCLTRAMLSEARGSRLSNISSLAFGGPDRRSVFLGSLGGESLATFRSPVAGVEPVHWNQRFGG